MFDLVTSFIIILILNNPIISKCIRKSYVVFNFQAGFMFLLLSSNVLTLDFVLWLSLYKVKFDQIFLSFLSLIPLFVKNMKM